MSVGVITSVETEDGTVKASDITPEKRRQWATRLAELVEQEDGVSNVSVSSLAKFANNQVGTLEIEIDVDVQKCRQQREWQTGMFLDANLRSLSPRIRNVLDDYNPLSSYTVSHSPTPTDGNSDTHDTNYYIIDINFY